MKKYRLDLKEILIDKENMSKELVDNITSVELVTMDDTLPPQVLVEQLRQLFDKLIGDFFIKKGEWYGREIDKENNLGKLEDILEKYGIESVEELDMKLANFDNFMKGIKFKTIEDLQNALNGKFIEVFDEKNKIWQDMVKKLTKTEKDRDTWKRACELALKEDYPNRNIPKEDWNEHLEIELNYFYQQAKKE